MSFNEGNDDNEVSVEVESADQRMSQDGLADQIAQFQSDGAKYGQTDSVLTADFNNDFNQRLEQGLQEHESVSLRYKRQKRSSDSDIDSDESCDVV